MVVTISPTIITIQNGGIQTISSPGYPSNYQNFVWKAWELRNSDSHGVLTISVNDMDIQNGDYLQIRDGNSSSSLIGQFNGTINPNPIITTSNYVWILFRSDSYGRSRGFQASIRAGNCIV